MTTITKSGTIDFEDRVVNIYSKVLNYINTIWIFIFFPLIFEGKFQKNEDTNIRREAFVMSNDLNKVNYLKLIKYNIIVILLFSREQIYFNI